MMKYIDGNTIEDIIPKFVYGIHINAIRAGENLKQFNILTFPSKLHVLRIDY